jgi:tetratricopeptide (TPR) repeat protein
MNASQSAAPQVSARKRRSTRLILLGLVFVLLALLAFAWWRRGTGSTQREGLPPFASPYQNVLPGVAYVGDETCAQCHPSQAASYRQHPMSRSLAPLARSESLERYDLSAHNPFESLGFQFMVERRPDAMLHQAIRRDLAGRVVVEVDAEIAFVLGSGTPGRSYLLNRDGYLFQSPLSWYTQKGAWDLSPGFEHSYPPERPVEVACLFCHSNQAEAVEDSRNRYRTPIFHGHGIGCERCHGPGALHVDSRRQDSDNRTEMPDWTIVNPRHLAAELREAVCQQCHLQGELRFVRQGRHAFDYRPGLPLHSYWAVFVRAPEFRDNQKAVGQVEQLADSRCFQASAGNLGCISCHDPHHVPSVEQRLRYYRDRCLDCHQEQSCALPLDVRRRQNANDSCTACHMPRVQSSDIAHTAVTDHRLLRKPENAERGPRKRLGLRAGEIPLVNFFEKELDLHDPAVSRDLGLALIDLTAQPIPGREALGPVGLALLEKSLSSSPDDAAAWEAKGSALALQGRKTEAVAAVETALARAPERESALEFAAELAEKMDRPTDAIAYLRRLRTVNPWLWECRYTLSKLLAKRREWQSALDECDAALRLNPTHEPARVLLILCCFRCGKEERARYEFQRLLALNPKHERTLGAWFTEQMMSSPERRH